MGNGFHINDRDTTSWGVHHRKCRCERGCRSEMVGMKKLQENMDPSNRLDIAKHIFRDHTRTADTWASGGTDGRTEGWVTSRTEEHQNGPRVVGVIQAVDTAGWHKICKISLQSNKCSAMETEVKGCELLLRTPDDMLRDETLDCSNVERAVEGTDTR